MKRVPEKYQMCENRMLINSVYLVGDKTYLVADLWLRKIELVGVVQNRQTLEKVSEQLPIVSDQSRFDTKTKESAEICRSDDES